MIPYILLVVCSFFFCHVAMRIKNGERFVCIGNNEYTQDQNWGFAVFFIMLLGLLACRDISVGNDTGSYAYYFEKYNSLSFSQVVQGEYDVLYGVLNWIIGRFTSEFQVLLFIVALVTVLPIARLYMEDRQKSYLQILLFLCIPFFEMMFSGIRQAIACSIGVIAYRYVKKRNILIYLLCVIAAWGIHSTSFILLAMYPVYHMRVKKKHLLFIVPVIAMLFIFNKPVFLNLTRIMFFFSKDIGNIKTTATGAFAFLLLLGMFAAVAYIIPDERKMDRELYGLRNLLLLSVMLQCFAPIHNIAMRVNYYYLLFVPVTMAKVLSIPASRYRKVASKIAMVLCVFFTFYFLYSINLAASTGDMLHIVPYLPFWEG